ncbi:hypothetical protein MTP03_34320 [Tsukamurella sp. PLM1]|nr:hypothetical protein MTP03_34320 [Tsukamurella sp. PLM1]
MRIGGVIHDFMMLNALRETHGAQAGFDLAIAAFRRALTV